jgi:O-antigen ligase
MFSGGDTSTQSRTDTFSAILDYLSDSPWTGRGFGTFLPALYRYTDNMYLLALVEMGIIGVVSLVGLMLAFLHCAGAGRRRFRDADRRELGWSFTAAAAVVILCTATFDTLSFPMVSGLFFLLLGLSGSYLGIARQQATTQPELSR